jgi:lipoyl-dependent peroxiredoxin
MIRRASAVWTGGIREGGGTLSTDSGVLSGAPYGFRSRFESGPGTNPEELLAAAHAGCFSMALSLILGEAGFTVERITTRASIRLEKSEAGFAITSSHLEVSAKVPGATAEGFSELANKAKLGCPVSKLFKADISMDARLES